MRWLIGLVTLAVGILPAPTLHAAPWGRTAPQGIGHEPRPSKPVGQEQAGYWGVRTHDKDGQEHITAKPYYPQPGDILLYNFRDPKISFALRLVGTGPPMHSAIVIERPDGTPAILEVGPNSKPQAFTRTYIVNVLPRLENYDGTILVRRPKQPLTPEQSAELTRFAKAQEGKPFAVARLFLQGTPFRCRYGLRKQMFARTVINRSRWICSENVVAAATVAGILDRKRFFANSMYPRDLAFDERYDLSPHYHPAVPWLREPVESADLQSRIEEMRSQ